MLTVRLVILAFLSLLCSPVLLGAALSPEALSAHLLTQTGFDALLEQYPALVKAGVARRARFAGAPEQITRDSARLIDGVFIPAELNRELQQRLQQRFDTTELASLVSWYNSPVGQKIVAAEMQGVSQADYASLQDSLSALQARYQGTERERLFAAYDSATYATRMMVDNGAAIQVAMAAVLSGVIKGPGLPAFAVLRQSIEAQRTAMRGVAGQQVYLNYLYTYQDISVEEIRDYIDFARSDLGARFFETLNSGLYEVLNAKSEGIEQQSLQAAL
jgi:hypothetical protein